MVKNKHVQKYGGAISFGLFGYYNASENVAWFRDNPVGVDKDKVHYYKNAALFWLIMKAGLAGLEIGYGNSTAWDVFKRSSFEALWVWDVWQLQKHYAVSGNAFDFRAEYNEHLFVFPTPFNKDTFKGFSGWRVPAIYITFGTIGTLGFING